MVATYDRPDGLARCLESLASQRVQRGLEIIVVDNHPRSGSVAPVRARFPGVRWLSEERPGLSHARNTGIEAAHGEIVVTTDDDVIAPPDWIEMLTAPLYARETERVAAATGNCLALKIETPAEVMFEEYGGLRHGPEETAFDRMWLARPSICFPQLWRIGTTANAAFSRLRVSRSRGGLFDESLGAGSPAGAWEDLYCFYLMLRAGYRIVYVPEAEVRHAHREDEAGLMRQLCGYRRGETAFLTLALIRHRDWRAIGQMLFWIPQWRLRVFCSEVLLRLRGRRKFPFALLWAELRAYLAGPSALLRARRLSRRASRKAAAGR